jgi:hypothetical protein
MKIGVGISPCAVESTPQRAAELGSVVISLNFITVENVSMPSFVPAGICPCQAESPDFKPVKVAKDRHKTKAV